jgi:hypothetical protein
MAMKTRWYVLAGSLMILFVLAVANMAHADQLDSSTESAQATDYDRLQQVYQQLSTSSNPVVDTITAYVSWDYSTPGTTDLGFYISDIDTNTTYVPYTDGTCTTAIQTTGITAAKTLLVASFAWYKNTSGGSCTSGPLTLVGSHANYIRIARYGGTGFQI